MVRSLFRIAGGVGLALVFAAEALVMAQTAPQSLGSVNVSRRVIANGAPLAPGTYTLRLLPEDLKPVVGQTLAESRWVEFVRGGKAVGREVATVLTGPEAKAVTKGPGPASGSSKTELLKGNEYLRIWVRRGGTHYLVHLALAKSE
jgi:hypothetical protein